MIVTVEFVDGSTQQAFHVDTLRIEKGVLLLDARRIDLTRVLSLRMSA